MTIEPHEGAYHHGCGASCGFFIVMKEKHMVKINGEDIAAGGKTVLEYLEENSYNLQRIAVERNEEIVPKTAYKSTVLNDGDKIEIVSFVGGG